MCSWKNRLTAGLFVYSLLVSPLHTQQQYKFVYMAVKHYVESQQALINVVSNNKSYTVNKDFSFGLAIRTCPHENSKNDAGFQLVV